MVKYVLSAGECKKFELRSLKSKSKSLGRFERQDEAKAPHLCGRSRSDPSENVLVVVREHFESEVPSEKCDAEAVRASNEKREETPPQRPRFLDAAKRF